MQRAKLYIIFMALLLSGAISFSQERFKTAVVDSLVEGGHTIKETSFGYEIGALQSNNGYHPLIYSIDFQGNAIGVDTFNSYNSISVWPFKYLDNYILMGKRDSLYDSPSTDKPFCMKMDNDLDTSWTLHVTDLPYSGNFQGMGYSVDNFLFLGGTYTKIPGQQDMFLIKMDTNGNVIWRQDYNMGSGTTTMLNLDVLADGGIIMSGGTTSFGSGVGQGTYDNYVRKVDSLGNFLWHRWFGDALGDEQCYANKISDTTLAVYGGIDVGGNNFNVFLGIVHNDGTILWDTTITMDASNNDYINNIVVLNDGSIVCSGSLRDPLISSR